MKAPGKTQPVDLLSDLGKCNIPRVATVGGIFRIRNGNGRCPVFTVPVFAVQSYPSLINAMKNPSRAPQKTKAKTGEVIASLAAAKKRYEVAQEIARESKADFKRIRKAYKQDPKAVAAWLEKTYPALA